MCAKENKRKQIVQSGKKTKTLQKIPAQADSQNGPPLKDSLMHTSLIGNSSYHVMYNMKLSIGVTANRPSNRTEQVGHVPELQLDRGPFTLGV
jgi:hypothetical protein